MSDLLWVMGENIMLTEAKQEAVVEKSSIADFLADQTIFITGATGSIFNYLPFN